MAQTIMSADEYMDWGSIQVSGLDEGRQMIAEVTHFMELKSREMADNELDYTLWKLLANEHYMLRQAVKEIQRQMQRLYLEGRK